MEKYIYRSAGQDDGKGVNAPAGSAPAGSAAACSAAACSAAACSAAAGSAAACSLCYFFKSYYYRVCQRLASSTSTLHDYRITAI